jgi:uncharacterized protein (TIGR00369 family)
MQVILAGDGKGEMRMPWSDALVGDPRSGVIFGGAVSALMDTCGGLAAFAHPGAGASVATLDLRIDYMRGARPGQAIVARAECYHMTRTVAFVRATAHDDDADNPVAMATGAFAVIRDEGTEL